MKSRLKFRRSSIFMVIVILALIVYAGISISNARGRYERAREDEKVLQAQVDQLKQENAELEYDIAHAGDPETIADTARSKLGLVMPGEKVLIDVGN